MAHVFKVNNLSLSDIASAYPREQLERSAWTCSVVPNMLGIRANVLDNLANQWIVAKEKTLNKPQQEWMWTFSWQSELRGEYVYKPVTSEFE